MDSSIQQKADAYDKNGIVKAEVEKALSNLKAFRIKFPFAEKPPAIAMLQPDDISKVNPNQAGEFFHNIEYTLKPLGHQTVYDSNVYYKIRLQLEDFKILLRVAVDKKRSLAEKVDAPWEKIKGLGDDKQIAKKIIFCFNYESGAVLPIFSKSHLKHFANKLADKPAGATKFYSQGEEYAHYTAELLKAKENLPITRAWENTYFTMFLYNTYPPPDSEKPKANPSGEGKTINSVTNEQLELRAFIKLLGELQTKRKITGQQFREYREQWTQQLPNDRDVLVWRLKQLNTETNTNPASPKTQSDEPQKRPTRQKL
jgi:hypothetical protein